ncbi:MAG: Maf family nucleotide pyrophosphatase [Proteobacteria bacterium]|nr:Maf family nucleotide pyrophosphatase [Pseudomonadota bacterium]MCL2306911.1 Maf family nucleotide pyrophosphatase [Pseudomonadota bacterium]
MNTPPATHLVLASTSPYRQELLKRFNLPFSVCAPEIDETPLPGETPSQLVLRLSEAKARAVARQSDCPSRSLIIGGDQVADCDGVAIGKPGDFDNARRQLRSLSGKTVLFRTGLALFNPQARRCRSVRVDIATTYRTLTDAEIEAYLHAAQPYNCAGSVRSEDLGIALFERIDNDDPTALIGLPLIALARLLRAEGVNPLLHQPLVSHPAP